MRFSVLSLICLIALCIPGFAAAADEASSTPVSYSKPSSLPSAKYGQPLVFSAPPRELEAQAHKIYDPIAQYLSDALRRKVVFEFAGTWGAYQAGITKGHYDIIFDGPHFNGWRVDHKTQNVLVRVPGLRSFVVFVKKDSQWKSLEQLAGRRICTPAPPNLGTLVLQTQFPNPSRTPYVNDVGGWKADYVNLMSGNCDAAVAPEKSLAKFDQRGLTRVIYTSQPLPDQAFSAGSRLSLDEQAIVRAALLAPEGAAATKLLREAYAIGPTFAPASNEEYAHLGLLLKDEFGWN